MKRTRDGRAISETVLLSVASIASYGAFAYIPLSIFINSEESALIGILTSITGIIVYIGFFTALTSNKLKIRRRHLLVLGYLLLFVSSLTISKVSISNKYVLLFFGRTIPAILAGSIIAQSNDRIVFKNISTVLMLLLSLCLTIFLVLTLMHGWMNSQGGFLYQTIAYAGAYAYAITTYLKVHYEHHNNYKPVRVSKHLLSTLQLLQFFGVLATGGRGGAVACLLILGLFVLDMRNKVRRVDVRIIVISFLLLMIIALLPSFDRFFQFGGLTRFLSSDRYGVYRTIIPVVRNGPLFGYGAIEHMDRLMEATNRYYWPHNIILELYMQWGVFSVIPVVICIVIPMAILNESRHTESYNVLAEMIFYVSMVNLMVSGTYITYAPFWFAIGYSYSIYTAKPVQLGAKRIGSIVEPLVRQTIDSYGNQHSHI